jgi:hypothetical protein
VTWRDPPPPATLGAAVFAVVRANVAESDECVGERLRLLDGEREAFIATFDRVVTPETGTVLADSVESVLLPLVDDQRLPALARSVARSLRLLVDDGADPERRALAEALAFFQARSVLSGRHLLGLSQRLFAYDQAPAVVSALADLGATGDQGGELSDSLLTVLAGRLGQAAEPIGCTGLALGDLRDNLLRPELLPASPELGPPAWAVFADAHGNPAAATDPQSGTLVLPFVDLDHDGAADVNGDGVAVDIADQPILLAPFSDEGERDPYGRALDGRGQLVFEYVDAKRTGLAVLLQFLGEAIAADAHVAGIRVLSLGMGPQIGCGIGCLTYPEEQHPVADLAFAVVEDLRFERTVTLLATLERLLRDQPVVAEDVLVAVGQMLAALDAGALTLADAALVDLAVAALPLCADVLAQDNSSGESTARLLLEVLHDLGGVARDLPEELRLNLTYVALHKEEACSATPPDEELSLPVDYDRPRYYDEPGVGRVDNRSALEQAIELLAAADCGSVPFTGGETVAEVVIGVMADSTPATACSIIDSSLGVMDILPTASELVGATALDLIGCDGTRVWRELWALDALAKSGVLDAYLPLANAFDDRGQVRTLIDIFRLVAADLQRDEESPGASVMRRALPTLIRVVESGTLDSLFDLNDLLVTLPALDGSGSIADVIVDSFAWLTDDSRQVTTRFGPRWGTSHAREILLPYRELIRRLDAAGRVGELEAVIDHLSGYLERTRVDDGGTPAPADDRVVLADSRLLPVYETLLGFAGELFDLSAAARDCYFDVAQHDLEAFFIHPDFATTVRLLSAFADSPGRAAIDTGLAEALSPKPDPEADLLGSWAQVLASVLQQLTPESLRGRELSRFGERALREATGTRLFSTLDVLWADDPNRLLFGLMSRLVDTGATRSERPPIAFFGDLYVRVADVRGSAGCVPSDLPWSTAEAEAAAQDVIAFLEDEQTGLPAVFELIRLRSNR